MILLKTYAKCLLEKFHHLQHTSLRWSFSSYNLFCLRLPENLDFHGLRVKCGCFCFISFFLKFKGHAKSNYLAIFYTNLLCSSVLVLVEAVSTIITANDVL